MPNARRSFYLMARLGRCALPATLWTLVVVCPRCGLSSIHAGGQQAVPVGLPHDCARHMPGSDHPRRSERKGEQDRGGDHRAGDVAADGGTRPYRVPKPRCQRLGSMPACGHLLCRCRIAAVPRVMSLPCVPSQQGFWRRCRAAHTPAAPSGSAPLVAPATPVAQRDRLDFKAFRSVFATSVLVCHRDDTTLRCPLCFLTH
jgi:hypothetical protein